MLNAATFSKPLIITLIDSLQTYTTTITMHPLNPLYNGRQYE